MLDFKSTILLLALPAAQITDARVFFAASPVFPVKRALELSVESLDARALQCQLVVKTFMIQASETAPSVTKLMSVGLTILPTPYETPASIIGTRELDATGIPGLKFHSGEILGSDCTEAKPRLELTGLKSSYAAGEALDLTWKALDVPVTGLSYSHQQQGDCDGLTWSEDTSGLHARGPVPANFTTCTADIVASVGDFQVTKHTAISGQPSILRAADLENRFDPNTSMVHTAKEHTHIFFEKTALTLAILPDLEGMNGNLYLQENPDLTYLDLPALKNLNGIFYLMKNPQLQTVYVPELQSITSNLYIQDNPELTTMHFPKLEKVDYVYVDSNKKLKTLIFDAVTDIKYLSLGYGIDDTNNPDIKFCFRKKLTVENVLVDLGRNLTAKDISNLEQSFVQGSLSRDFQGQIKPLTLQVYTADKKWVYITPKGDGRCSHL